MSGVEPHEIARATHTVADYGRVLWNLFPVAFIGGVIGVWWHFKQIMKCKNWKARLAMGISEWSVGAAAAMLVALLLPVTGLTPSIEAEIGLAGFVGGCAGRGVFQWFIRQFFPMERRQDDHNAKNRGDFDGN